MTYQTIQNYKGTQRSSTKAHLSVVQRKEGLRGRHLGSADPLCCPNPYWAQIGPSFACRLPLDWLRQPLMVPPRKFIQGSTIGGLYKEEESTPFNTPPFWINVFTWRCSPIVLQRKDEALPRLALRVGRGWGVVWRGVGLSALFSGLVPLQMLDFSGTSKLVFMFPVLHRTFAWVRSVLLLAGSSLRIYTECCSLWVNRRS